MLTLLESAKLSADGGEVYQAGVIELYAQSSSILENLRFQDIQGNAMRYNREEKLPDVGFRGVNESFTESTGIINPQVEVLAIAGGDLDVDNFILKTQGEGVRTTHEAMKIKALAGAWTRTFFKGDTETDPKEFSGLQSRIIGDQLFSAGSTSGGAALSLAILDEAIDAVDNPTAICMNKAMRRKLSAASNDSSVGGDFDKTVDAFGRKISTYADLPILIVDEDNNGDQILGFTEASASGAATSTSIYILSMAEDGVHGIQNGSIEARDLGELETKSAKRTRVEWFPGMAVKKGKAAARIRHIGNLAVVK